MYNTVILPTAKQDINEAALWYNSKQIGLGKRFTTHIREKVHLLKQYPYVVAIIYDDTRTAVLDIKTTFLL